MPDNIFSNNKFELVFDEKYDGEELIKLYKNS